MIDLDAEERAGGHTLALHVGKSETWLLDRLSAGPRPDSVSSFLDQLEAEAAVTLVLDVYAGRIAEWLSGEVERKLVLIHRMPHPVGLLVTRSGEGVPPAAAVCVVLQRLPRHRRGYVVRTAFPKREAAE